MSNEQRPLPEVSDDVYSARVLGRLVTTEQGIVLTKMAHMADFTGTREFTATYEEIAYGLFADEEGYTGADLVAIVVPWLIYKGLVEQEKVDRESWQFRIADREILVEKVLETGLEEPWENLDAKDPGKWELDPNGHVVRDSVRNAKTALGELEKLLHDWEDVPDRDEDYEVVLFSLRHGWEVDWATAIREHIGYSPTLRAVSIARRGER